MTSRAELWWSIFRLEVLLCEFTGRPKCLRGPEVTAPFNSLRSDKEANRFKYVVMDVSMPVMDGIEATRIACQQVKSPKLTEVAVITALSELEAASTRQEMFHAGAVTKFKELMYFRSSCKWRRPK